MGVIDSEKKARLLARKTSLEEALDAAYEMRTRVMSNEIKEYRFDSGEGNQRVERRTLEDINKSIYHLEISLKRVCQELNGRLNVWLNVRRKQ